MYVFRKLKMRGLRDWRSWTSKERGREGRRNEADEFWNGRALDRNAHPILGSDFSDRFIGQERVHAEKSYTERDTTTRRPKSVEAIDENRKKMSKAPKHWSKLENWHNSRWCVRHGIVPESFKPDSGRSQDRPHEVRCPPRGRWTGAGMAGRMNCTLENINNKFSSYWTASSIREMSIRLAIIPAGLTWCHSRGMGNEPVLHGHN